MKYRNPIIPGFYPDPSVCRVGEDYYLVASSFEYFPGVPVFHSRDLVNWRQIGHCLTRESQLPLQKERCSGGIYAPTIRHHDGTFYMVTTNVRGSDGKGPRHFYVHTQDPAGQWSEPVWTESHNIDPSLFFDEDGKVYFTCNGHDGIYQWQIDIRTGRRLTDIRHIWRGSGGWCAEAPHLYKMFGRYYLMVAEGGTEYGHMETIARSRTPWGPWEPCPFNPVLTHRNTQGDGISGTGHADLVHDHRGNWWAVFLAFRPAGGFWHNMGRETFLAPVKWTDDGWPVVGGEEEALRTDVLDRTRGKGTVRQEMDGPTLPPHPWPAAPARDDFNAPSLDLCWNFLRNPQTMDYSLTERPGWLRLRGSSVTLDHVDSPTFVGRRQQHFNCRVTARLEFNARELGREAGLTILMNNSHHYEIALTMIAPPDLPPVPSVIVRRRIGDLSVVVAQATGVYGPVRLRIEGDRDNYTFSFAPDDGPATPGFQVLAKGSCRYLSSEVAGGFTGAYFGLYATGPAAESYADFDWFEYLPLPD